MLRLQKKYTVIMRKYARALNRQREVSDGESGKALALPFGVLMGNTTSGKMLKEVVADARAVLKATGKNTFEQVKARRQDVQRQLDEVSKHKEDLLQRRAAGVRAIVKEYAAKREMMLEHFASDKTQQPPAFGAGSAPLTDTASSAKDSQKKKVFRATESSSSTHRLLPSPEEVFRKAKGFDESRGSKISSTDPSKVGPH